MQAAALPACGWGLSAASALGEQSQACAHICMRVAPPCKAHHQINATAVVPWRGMSTDTPQARACHGTTRVVQHWVWGWRRSLARCPEGTARLTNRRLAPHVDAACAMTTLATARWQLCPRSRAWLHGTRPPRVCLRAATGNGNVASPRGGQRARHERGTQSSVSGSAWPESRGKAAP